MGAKVMRTWAIQAQRAETRRDSPCPAMQAELEPTVRIRELLKDRVDFVLENVDLACVTLLLTVNACSVITGLRTPCGGS